MHEILSTENCSNEKISQKDRSSLNTGDKDDECILNHNSIYNHATEKCVSFSSKSDKYDDDDYRRLKKDRPKLISHNLLSKEISDMKHDSCSNLPCGYSPNENVYKSLNTFPYENKVKHDAQLTLLSHKRPSKLNSSVEGFGLRPENNRPIKKSTIIDDELLSAVQLSSFVKVKESNISDKIKEEQCIELVQVDIDKKIATVCKETKTIPVTEKPKLTNPADDIVSSIQSNNKSLDISAISFSNKKVESNNDKIVFNSDNDIISKLDALGKDICSPTKVLIYVKKQFLEDGTILSTLDLSSSLKDEKLTRSEEFHKEELGTIAQVSKSLNETDFQKSISIEEPLQLSKESELSDTIEAINSNSQLCIRNKYSLNEKSFNVSIVVDKDKKEAECDSEETAISHDIISKLDAPGKDICSPTKKLIYAKKKLLQEEPLLNAFDSSSKKVKLTRSEEFHKEELGTIAQVSKSLSETDFQKSISIEEPLQLPKESELSDTIEAINSNSQLCIRNKYSLNEKSFNVSIVVDKDKKEAECDSEETAISHDIISKLDAPGKDICSPTKKLIYAKKKLLQEEPLLNAFDSSSKKVKLTRSEEFHKEELGTIAQVSKSLRETDFQKSISIKEPLQLPKESELSDTIEAINSNSQLCIRNKYSLNEKSFNVSIVVDKDKKKAECDREETAISHDIISKLDASGKDICSPTKKLIYTKKKLLQEEPLLNAFDSSSKKVKLIRTNKFKAEQPVIIAQVSKGLSETDCQKGISISEEPLQLPNESELSDSEEASNSNSQLCMSNKYSLNKKSFNVSIVVDEAKKEAECDSEETAISHDIISKIESSDKNICSPTDELIYANKQLFLDEPILSMLDSFSSQKVKKLITLEELNGEQPAKIVQISKGLNETDCQKGISISEEPLQLPNESELSDSEESSNSNSQLCMSNKYSLNKKSFNVSIVVDEAKKKADCDSEETAISHDIISKIEGSDKNICSPTDELIYANKQLFLDEPILSTLNSFSSQKVKKLITLEELNGEQPAIIVQISKGLNDTDCQKGSSVIEEPLQLLKESELSDTKEAINSNSQLCMLIKYSLNEKFFDVPVVTDKDIKESDYNSEETTVSLGIDSKLEASVNGISSSAERVYPEKHLPIRTDLDSFLKPKGINEEIYPVAIAHIEVNENKKFISDCQNIINKREQTLPGLSDAQEAIFCSSETFSPSKYLSNKKSLQSLVFGYNKCVVDLDCDIRAIDEVSHRSELNNKILLKPSSFQEKLVCKKQNYVNDIILNVPDSSSTKAKAGDLNTMAELPLITVNDNIKRPECQKSLALSKEPLDLNFQLSDRADLSDSKELNVVEFIVDKSDLNNAVSENIDNLGDRPNNEYLEKQFSTDELLSAQGKKLKELENTPHSQIVIEPSELIVQNNGHNDTSDKKLNHSSMMTSDLEGNVSVDKSLFPKKCSINVQESFSPKISNDPSENCSEKLNKNSHFRKSLKGDSSEKEKDCKDVCDGIKQIASPCESIHSLSYGKISEAGKDTILIPKNMSNSIEKLNDNGKIAKNISINVDVGLIAQQPNTIKVKTGLLANNFQDMTCIQPLSPEISLNLDVPKKFRQANNVSALKSSTSLMVINSEQLPIELLSSSSEHRPSSSNSSKKKPETYLFPSSPTKSICETETSNEKLYVFSPLAIQGINSSNKVSVNSCLEANIINSTDVINSTECIPPYNSEESDCKNMFSEQPCKILSDSIENYIVDNDEVSCLENIKIVSVTSGESCSINVGQDSFKECQENSDDENISSAVSNIVENLYKSNDPNIVLMNKDVKIVADTEYKVNATNSDFSLAIIATNDLCGKIINLDETGLAVDKREILPKCSSSSKRKLSDDEYEDENNIKRLRPSHDSFTIKEEKFEGFLNRSSIASGKMGLSREKDLYNKYIRCLKEDITAVKQEIVEELLYNELDLSMEARSKLLTSSFIAKKQKQQLKKLSPKNGSKSVCSKKKKALLRSKNDKNCSVSEVNFLDIPECLKKIAKGFTPSLLVERERINVDDENEDDKKILVTCLVFDSTVLDWAFIDTLLSHKESNAVNIIQKSGGKNAFIFPPVNTPRDRYYCVDLGSHFPFVMPSQTSVNCSDEVVPLSYPLQEFAILCPSSTSVRPASFKGEIIPIKTIQFAKEPLEFAFNNTLLSSMEDSPILSCTLDLPVDHKVWPDVPDTLLLPNFNVDYSFPFTCSDKQRQYENILFFPFETQIPLKLMESQLIQDIPDELQRELDAERSSLARLLGLASYYKYLSVKKVVQENVQLSVTLSSIVSSFKPMIISQANSYGMKIEEARLVTLGGIYSKDESILPSLIRGPVNGNKCNLFSQSGITRLERSVGKNYFNVLKRKR